MSKKDVKKKAPQKTNLPVQKPAVKAQPKVEVPLGEAPKKLSERQLILQSHRDEDRQRRRRNLILIAVIAGLLFVLVLSIIFGSRQPTLSASLSEEGSLACFPAGLLDEQGAPVDCSVSAVLYDAVGNLNLASRNLIPGEEYASIFSVPFADGKPATDTIAYQTAENFLLGLDYESMAISSDGDYNFAATGFDRVKSDSDEWNYYNVLLAWPPSDPSKVQVVSSTTTAEGVKSSVSLRNKFSQLLNSAAYFKVGGLTAIPGDYLIFGLTDIGESAETNQALFKLIAVPYSVSADTGELNLSDRFLEKYTLEPAKTNPEITQKLSLVSLEYDTYKNRFLILAGFDDGTGNSGAYLWVLTLNDFNNAGLPQLVTDASGAPFVISGHPAGLTLIGKDTYLISNNAVGREPQQATYQIIKLSR